MRIMLAVAALGLGLSGCSGDDGGTATGSTDSAGATSSPTDSTSATTTGSTDSATGSTDSTTGGSMSTSGGSTGGTSATGGGSTGGGSTGGVDACGNAPGQLLLPSMPWNTAVDGAAVASDSEAVIAYLQNNVTGGARFQIDFSITVQERAAGDMRYSFNQTGDFYSPDCDPADVPVPLDGHIEGEAGNTCDGDGDCHLIVVDRDECRLYEQWRADFGGPTSYDGGCLAIWSLDQSYDETLRGDYCTSADAAGLPIAPLLFTADEIQVGEIRHAMRFIVPNANIRDDIYVRPGTHSTGATSGPSDAPPYAARLRLKADTDITGLNAAAQVVAQAMKTYGIILADAGNVTFTAASDDFTTASWADVGLGPHDLKDLQWSDFERVDTGAGITWSDGDCSRTPITD